MYKLRVNCAPLLKAAASEFVKTDEKKCDVKSGCLQVHQNSDASVIVCKIKCIRARESKKNVEPARVRVVIMRFCKGRNAAGEICTLIILLFCQR